MITFYSETDFQLEESVFYSDWIAYCVEKEGFTIEAVNVIFCDDEYLLEINKKHLDHDYYTDIITFDYSDQKSLEGEIFISIDRVSDNAFSYSDSFDQELSRVLIHGFLHMMGYKDKTEEEQQEMRSKETECIQLQSSDSE